MPEYNRNPHLGCTYSVKKAAVIAPAIPETPIAKLEMVFRSSEPLSGSFFASFTIMESTMISVEAAPI